MLAAKLSPDFAVAQPLGEISDTALLPLGTRVRGNDPTYGAGEYIYLKGVASTIEGSVVTFNGLDGTTALLVANAIGPVAVAKAACIANKYGWYQIYGLGVAKVSAAFADNANCYATATPGEIDDAIVAGDRIKLMKGASAIATPAAGFALVEMHHPSMDDGLAA